MARQRTETAERCALLHFLPLPVYLFYFHNCPACLLMARLLGLGLSTTCLPLTLHHYSPTCLPAFYLPFQAHTTCASSALPLKLLPAFLLPAPTQLCLTATFYAKLCADGRRRWRRDVSGLLLQPVPLCLLCARLVLVPGDALHDDLWRA